MDYVDKGEGVSYRLIRSIACLRQVQHPHIISLLLVNIDPERNEILLFFDDAGTSLETLLDDGLKDRGLSFDVARRILWQLLQALVHCHAQGVTHRNLKPKYIFLQSSETNTQQTAQNGGAEYAAAHFDVTSESDKFSEDVIDSSFNRTDVQVRLADFNSVRWLATSTSEDDAEVIYGTDQVFGSSSPTVVTQPYRAPEILLGSSSYSSAIDVWACGCVFAEMVSGKLLFPGDSDIGQLVKIFELLGTPGLGACKEQWPGVENLPHFNHLFPAMRPKDVDLVCPVFKDEPEAKDLLLGMLQLDPKQRISAAEALHHPFFANMKFSSTDENLIKEPCRNSVKRAKVTQGDFCQRYGSCDAELFRSPMSPTPSQQMSTRNESIPDGTPSSSQLHYKASSELDLDGGAALWRSWLERERKKVHVSVYDNTCRLRAVCWLLAAATEFCRCDRTVHHATRILDEFLLKSSAVISNEPDPNNPLAISVAISALLLACKFQEVEIHSVDHFVRYSGFIFTQEFVLSTELRLCAELEFDFATPTSVDFLFVVLRRLHWPALYSVHRGQHKKVVALAHYLCELSLLSPSCACEPASLVASAALCLAIACLRTGIWHKGVPGAAQHPYQYWTASMEVVSTYKWSDLIPIIELLQAEHSRAYVHVNKAEGNASVVDTLSISDALSEKDTNFLFGISLIIRKFQHPRFLGVTHVPCFVPHEGGDLENAQSENFSAL